MFVLADSDSGYVHKAKFYVDLKGNEKTKDKIDETVMDLVSDIHYRGALPVL